MKMNVLPNYHLLYNTINAAATVKALHSRRIAPDAYPTLASYPYVLFIAP